MLPSIDPSLHTPERQPFIRKLRNFLIDHAFEDVPTLVLQCAPVDAQTIDLIGGRMDQTLLQGTGELVDGGWWAGFAGGNRQKCFDGFATFDSSDEKLWAAELQDDGHILAAVRAISCSESVFSEFGVLVGKYRDAANISGAFRLTATLVNARGLTLLSNSGYGRTRTRTIGRETVEWPVSTATADEIGDACEQMRCRLKRLFP
jgi:hypothetical protein